MRRQAAVGERRIVAYRTGAKEETGLSDTGPALKYDRGLLCDGQLLDLEGGAVAEMHQRMYLDVRTIEYMYLPHVFNYIHTGTCYIHDVLCYVLPFF